MAIEFHCDHCGRLVKTSDEHAGKRGKCPHCHQSVYIPTPSEQIEPLPLAPLDPAEEREKRRLAEETRQVVERLRSEREAPPEVPKKPLPEPEGDVRLRPDMEYLVVEYVRSMFAGNLSQAEQYAAEIHQDPDRAREVIQQLAQNDQLPSALAKIPRAVLIGFLKQLRG